MKKLLFSGFSLVFIAGILTSASCGPGKDAPPSPEQPITPVGKIEKLVGTAIALNQQGEDYTLAKESPVHLYDTITTRPVSRLAVEFIDNTVLSLGENSEVVIDNYVFAADSQDVACGLRANKGVLRVVTGQITKMRPDRFSITTRFGTIGIRGCDVIVDLRGAKLMVFALSLGEGETLVIEPSKILAGKNVPPLEITSQDEAMVMTIEGSISVRTVTPKEEERVLKAITTPGHARKDDQPLDAGALVTDISAFAAKREAAAKKKARATIERVQPLLERNPKDTKALIDWGCALRDLDLHEEAIQKFKSVLEISPEHANAYYHWGNSLWGLCQFDNALDKFETARDLKCGYPDLPFIFIALLNDVGRSKEAIEKGEALLAKHPHSLAVLNNVAWVLATASNGQIRDGQRAMELSLKSLKIARRNPNIRPVNLTHLLDTLACCCAEVRQFDRAILIQEQVIDMPGSHKLTAEHKSRIMLFKQKRPYHVHRNTNPVR